jgi:hypothetical protein
MLQQSLTLHIVLICQKLNPMEYLGSSHRLVGNGHARWLMRVCLHPYVRREGPSLRPDLSLTGQRAQRLSRMAGGHREAARQRH